MTAKNCNATISFFYSIARRFGFDHDRRATTSGTEATIIIIYIRIQAISTYTTTLNSYHLAMPCRTFSSKQDRTVFRIG